MFVRRNAPPAGPLTYVRVGMFFFGAGVWLAGVWANNETATTVAMVVIAVAILIGWVGRRHPAEDAIDDDWESDEEVEPSASDPPNPER
jgi:hypothetical protein